MSTFVYTCMIYLFISLQITGLFRPVVFVTPPPLVVLPYGIAVFIENWFIPMHVSIVSDLTPLGSKPIIFALNGVFVSVAGLAPLMVTPVVSATDLPTALMTLTGSLLAFSSLFLVLASIILQRRKKRLVMTSSQGNKGLDEKTS